MVAIFPPGYVFAPDFAQMRFVFTEGGGGRGEGMGVHAIGFRAGISISFSVLFFIPLVIQ